MVNQRARTGRWAAGLVLVSALALSATGVAQPPQAPPPALPGSGPGSPQVFNPLLPQPPNGPPSAGFEVSMPAFGKKGVRKSRFTFVIEPNTAKEDLLPARPKFKRISGPFLSDDLAKAPEVEFAARPAKDAAPADLMKDTAHQLAKMNHMNAKKTDAFMTALLESRPDLSGMPFVMGDDCRTTGERSKQFTQAVAVVRQALAVIQGNPPGAGVSFWQQYHALVQQHEQNQPRPDRALAEHIAAARVAALTQMLAAETADVRLGLAKHLAGVSNVDATKALAHMAIYSAEDDVRFAALDALKVRREKDYTEILVKGLYYPWPAVAKHAADAIARLERKDLIPQLLAVLDDADPRSPAVKDAGGKPITVVREMVKMNHHRNCMMCHSPGNPSTAPEALSAEVPIQGQPLPTPAQGYRQSSPDLMIRVDVTYLRQDFSTMLPVTEAQPWPESQRFDFFVRERKIDEDDVAAYRETLTPKEPGVLSPYHRAALAALRELTGKDAAPTAEAWRKLLDVPKVAPAKVD